MSDENRERQSSDTLEQLSRNLSNNIVNANKQSNTKTGTSVDEEIRTKIGALTQDGDVKINTQNNIFVAGATVVSAEIANNVPRRNFAELLGRENILEQLHTSLTLTTRPASIALCGMGGIGKTEIALRYAQNYAEDYPGGICWLSCRDTDVKAQIVNFARSYLGIELSKESDSENQLNICWAQWRKGNVLIVFDDVPDLGGIVPFLPPNHLRFKVLVTTRQTHGVVNFKFIPVSVLEESVALQLLKNSLGEDDTRIAQELEQTGELCRWLDYLPLGLELVGRYLERRQDITLSSMLERLKAEKLGQESIQGGVSAALEVSWNELSPDAKKMGYILSLFAVAPIPWWIVEGVQPDSRPQELERWRDDELRRFSLLQRQESGIYQFHHLTREFIQSKLNDTEVADDLKRAFCQSMVRLIERLLANEAPAESETTPQVLVLVHIEEMVTVIPHLMEVKDLFTIYQTLLLVYSFQGFYREAALWGERCKLELTAHITSKELVAINLYRLATVYKEQGKYEEAEKLLVEALEIGKLAISDSDYDAFTAQVLSELGGIRAACGKFEQAQEDCQKAVELKEELNGSESPAVADSLFTLAEVCRVRGQYEEAGEYYVRAFEIYSVVFEVGDDSNVNPICIAIGLINISVLLLELGENATCELLGEQAIEIVKAVVGDEHPLYATCLTNLASTYRNQGKHLDAEKFCQRAIAINEERNNTGHPTYAASLINLALIYMTQGRFDEAATLYERALTVREHIYGVEHHQVAEVLVLLAVAYLSQKRDDDAEQCLKEGQKMYELTLGIAHPKYGEVLSDLASVRANQEQYDEAEQLLRDAIKVFKEAYGEVHPKVSEKLAILAFFLIIRERYDEAKTLFQESLDIVKKVFGEDDPNVCAYILAMAELSYSNDQKEEADDLYAQAIGIYEQEREKKINPDFSQGLMTLIELYESQKRYREVEALYERLIDTTRRLLGSDHPNLALLLTRLAKLKLDSWCPKEASELYEDALKIRQHIFSDKHALTATSMVNLAYAYQALNRSQEAKELYVQALEIRITEYGNSHQQVTVVKKALASLDYALEKSKQSSTKSLPVGDPPSQKNNSASSEVETNVPKSQSNEVLDVLHQDITAQSKTAECKAAETKALEQKKAELESQLLQLEAQKQALEAEIERYQQKFQVDQTNLLIVAEQLICLSQTERAKLAEPLSLVLADLEEQQQEYQQTWDRLQTAIQQFNTYQEETDEVRFHLNTHYQADDSLTEAFPLDRRKVEHILQAIREQLTELDQELTSARSQHEKSQQKTIIRF